MRIIVSACLLGECCKYSGGHNRDERVLAWIRGHQVIPVCPEQLGGLPTPRTPCERRGGRVVDREGLDRTAAFELGADRAVAAMGEEMADLAILQPRSPSCGVGWIYDGSFSGRLIPGNGVFVEKILAMGIPAVTPDQLPPAEEGRGEEFSQA